MSNNVNDLRSAIELLKGIPGQFMETDRPVGVDATVAGMYAKIGARGTIKRPTKLGPMLLCKNVG